MAVDEAMYSGVILADAPAVYLKGGYPAWPGTTVGWWTDASGNNRHSTGGGGSQIAVGQTALLPWMSTSFGIFGATDATSYMEFSNNPVSPAGDYTIEFWFKRTGNGKGGAGEVGGIGYGGIISKGGGANNDALIYEDRDLHHLSHFVEPGGTDTYIGSGNAALNDVHHYAWTVTGTTGKSYYDGRRIATTTLPAGARPNTGNWRIGKGINTYFGAMTGLLNHVAWYSSVLSEEKIRHRYKLATDPQGERYGVVY